MDERRRDYPDLLTRLARIEEKIIAVDKRINGSIEEIEKHIEHGQAWRLAIIGVAGLLIFQSLVFASMWGKLCSAVDRNSSLLDKIIEIRPKIAEDIAK